MRCCSKRGFVNDVTNGSRGCDGPEPLCIKYTASQPRIRKVVTLAANMGEQLKVTLFVVATTFQVLGCETVSHSIYTKPSFEQHLSYTIFSKKALKKNKQRTLACLAMLLKRGCWVKIIISGHKGCVYMFWSHCKPNMQSTWLKTRKVTMVIIHL